MLARLPISSRIGICAVVSHRGTNLCNGYRFTSTSASEQPNSPVDILKLILPEGYAAKVSAKPASTSARKLELGLPLNPAERLELGLTSSATAMTPPRAPTDKIPPGLTREEIDKYIFTMLGRHSRGWNFQRPDPKTPFYVLKKAFHFKTYRDTVSFARAVTDIAQTEKHHPDIAISFGRVEVATITHKAVHPGQELSADNQRIVSLLTLRDVRLAVLVENVFVEGYLVKGRAKVRTPGQQSSQRDDSNTGASQSNMDR